MFFWGREFLIIILQFKTFKKIGWPKTELFLVVTELCSGDEFWPVEEHEHEVEGCDIDKDRLTSSEEL